MRHLRAGAIRAIDRRWSLKGFEHISELGTEFWDNAEIGARYIVSPQWDHERLEARQRGTGWFRHHIFLHRGDLHIVWPPGGAPSPEVRPEVQTEARPRGPTPKPGWPDRVATEVIRYVQANRGKLPVADQLAKELAARFQNDWGWSPEENTICFRIAKLIDPLK
jgi:hypothetical protein